MSGVPVTHAFTAAPCPPPYCISNKFPHHYCHIYAAEEGNILNYQSVPKIKPCLIVSQRKAIVCLRETPQSQGLSADSLKSLTPCEHINLLRACFHSACVF